MPAEPAELPYQLHTNRELGMMLRGEKPLAVFTDGHESFPTVLDRYLRLFDRYVASGRLIRRDLVVPDERGRTRGWHTILFALPRESWRIDAMIELRLSAEWLPEQERREGELLGYTDAQNDIWLNRQSKR